MVEKNKEIYAFLPKHKFHIEKKMDFCLRINLEKMALNSENLDVQA